MHVNLKINTVEIIDLHTFQVNVRIVVTHVVQLKYCLVQKIYIRLIVYELSHWKICNGTFHMNKIRSQKITI